MRDVFDCCRHYPGLQPKLEYFVFDTNQSLRLLVLDGVIPIVYRTVTYHIPIHIWCMRHYPNEAPIPYVRPTASMVLRQRHPHVDSEGRVYLNRYLSEWDPTQYTFYGVAAAMIRVFTHQPPVNSRPPVASPATEGPERGQLIMSLSKRISDRLNEVNEEATEEIGVLLQQKDELVVSDKNMSDEMREKAMQYKAATDQLDGTQARIKELEEWVRSVGSTGEESHIDDRLRYKNILDEQVVDCAAHDAAYSDALDRVDDAFVQNVIDQERYMKDIRRLSREQFFHRALKRRIELTASRKPPRDGDGPAPRRLASSRIAPMYAS